MNPNNPHQSIKLRSILGAVFTILTGSLSHFAYRWSGSLTLVGLFCPVNESIWEHLKLIFFPMVLFSFGEYFWLQTRNTPPVQLELLFPTTAYGALVGMVSVVTLYYTYSGILGINLLPADLAVYVVSVVIASFLLYQMRKKKQPRSKKSRTAGYALIFVFTLLFFLFTLWPPKLPLFQDPQRSSNESAQMSLP